MAQRVTIRFYRRYRQIAVETREWIQYKLGRRRGVMRTLARKSNPACVVAFRNGKAIGWAALFKPGVWKNKYRPGLQVYVRKKDRGEGLGPRLLERLDTHLKLRERKVRLTYWPGSKAAQRCFAKAGIKKS